MRFVARAPPSLAPGRRAKYRVSVSARVAGEIKEVALAPQYAPPGGEFVVTVDDAVIWDRRVDGGFPEIKVLKQRVRDVVDPDISLGHSDVPEPPAEPSPPPPPAEAASSWEDDWRAETDLKSDDDVAAKLAELSRLTSMGRNAAVKLIEESGALQRPPTAAPDDVDDAIDA